MSRRTISLVSFLHRYGLLAAGEGRALFSRVCDGSENNLDDCQRLGSVCTLNDEHSIAFRCGSQQQSSGSMVKCQWQLSRITSSVRCTCALCPILFFLALWRAALLLMHYGCRILLRRKNLRCTERMASFTQSANSWQEGRPGAKV